MVLGVYAINDARLYKLSLSLPVFRDSLYFIFLTNLLGFSLQLGYPMVKLIFPLAGSSYAWLRFVLSTWMVWIPER